jgi:hypothetical protein
MFGFDSYIAITTIASLLGGPEALAAMLVGIGAAAGIGIKALLASLDDPPWSEAHPVLAGALAATAIMGVVAAAWYLRNADLTRVKTWLDQRVALGKLSSDAHAKILAEFLKVRTAED